MQDLTPAQAALRDAARNYHRQPTRGKVAVAPTKSYRFPMNFP